MNKKYLLYILIFICFLFPIISVEDIVPWVVSLIAIHKSIKIFKKKEELKPVIINTLLAGGIILAYNIVTGVIERYLVKMWL